MTARRRTLVLGGVRSGKSGWAERQFEERTDVRYVATAAERDDADWAQRIAAHRDRRPAHWRTVQTLDLAGELESAAGCVLIEDVGNWVSRTIDDTEGWNGDLTGLRTRADQLVRAWRNCAATVVLVTNEVGSGVHPLTRAGRIFSDELGRLNTALAAEADEVVLVVAGLPLWLRTPVLLPPPVLPPPVLPPAVVQQAPEKPGETR